MSLKLDEIGKIEQEEEAIDPNAEQFDRLGDVEQRYMPQIHRSIVSGLLKEKQYLLQNPGVAVLGNVIGMLGDNNNELWNFWSALEKLNLFTTDTVKRLQEKHSTGNISEKVFLNQKKKHEDYNLFPKLNDLSLALKLDRSLTSSSRASQVLKLTLDQLSGDMQSPLTQKLGSQILFTKEGLKDYLMELLYSMDDVIESGCTIDNSDFKVFCELRNRYEDLTREVIKSFDSVDAIQSEQYGQILDVDLLCSDGRTEVSSTINPLRPNLTGSPNVQAAYQGPDIVREEITSRFGNLSELRAKELARKASMLGDDIVGADLFDFGALARVAATVRKVTSGIFKKISPAAQR